MARRMPTALSILKGTFGFDAFRGQQAEIIDQLARGNNVMALAPTGGGKSLCYQIPALMRPGTAIVICPLIALMRDQVTALKNVWVTAAMLNSKLTAAQAAIVKRRFVRGDYKFLYVSPETALTPEFQELLDAVMARNGLSLFAFDEAHCVSQWGHDFRKDYLRLSELVRRYPRVPRIALTATADATTRDEIAVTLGLEYAAEFISSFDRPNIRYLIAERKNGHAQLLDFLRREHEGHAGIVYCLSKNYTEATAEFLTSKGIRALPYHAGMSAQECDDNQDMFQRRDDVVMVATIAFGMGIDKANVRFVAHLGLPKSIEAYYQETGRAGRDGEPADAWMVHGDADVMQQLQFIDKPLADMRYKSVSIARLDALRGLCETTGCRRERLLGYFDEESQPCGNCDNCLSPPRAWNGTGVVRNLLSCVFRTGQRFAAQYIIDILIGQETESIRRFRHNHLAGLFGVGADRSDVDWRSIIRQTVAHGLLSVDYVHDGLSLTNAGLVALEGRQRVALRKQSQKWYATKKASRQSGGEPAVTKDILWERLNSWRSAMAKSREVPTYAILDDRTLLLIASKKPTSLGALGQIAGISATNLAKYGNALFEIVLANQGVGS